uniref:Mothers against decapentaplegic like protein 6/7 n=1 Tax=Rhipicephalus appendiculatus TaxID=34631 RepID=A0A131YKD8_RHIAP
MPTSSCCCTTPSAAMERTVCACRALLLAWLRRLKKYLRLSKGIVKRLRPLVNALRALLRRRCNALASFLASTAGYSATLDCPSGTAVEPSGEDEPWCRIAYWELSNRVGDLYQVRRPCLHITFDESPASLSSSNEEALRLHSLAAHSSSSEPNREAVARTRAKIGQGLTLSYDHEGVWVYNRSEHAVFVASPTLDAPQVRNLTVFKVLPGISQLVFSWKQARLHSSFPPVPWDGPHASNVARISFVKGWGPKYARQIVTALPCSLELFFRTTPPPPR